MFKLEFAKKIQRLINQSGLNKTELSQKANISRTSLYKILRGEVTEIKLTTIVSLSDALDVSPVELLYPYLKQLAFEGTLGSATLNVDTQFISDVTYPDNSIVYTSQKFEKIWTVRNQGATAWKDLYLECQDDPVHLNGIPLGLKPVTKKIPIPETLPGEKAIVSVLLIAPSLPGTVISQWKAVTEEGALVFPDKNPLYCMVKVIQL